MAIILVENFLQNIHIFLRKCMKRKEEFTSLRDIIRILSVSWKSVWIENTWCIRSTDSKQRCVVVTRILLTMSETSICKLLLWQNIDTHYRKITCDARYNFLGECFREFGDASDVCDLSISRTGIMRDAWNLKLESVTFQDKRLNIYIRTGRQDPIVVRRSIKLSENLISREVAERNIAW